MRVIPYGRQDISEADIEAVVAVLRSDFLTQGPAIECFEQAIATYTGASHAVAVNSATAALHLACKALGLEPGDRLWTVPNTFVASANCGLYCGASVDFVDIDPATLNMSLPALEAKLAAAAAQDRLPKIVVPVAFSGEPCDMRAIWALAQRYGFFVVEDASHAIGGWYDGRPIGDGRYAHATVFSFHPVKIVTTAEGGLITTNDPALATALRELRSHGITRDPARMAWESDGPWYYQQTELGFNYRMPDMLAALGASQMTRLDEFIAARHRLAARYDALLADLPLTLPYRNPAHRSGLHLYVVQLQRARLTRTRRHVFEALRAAGVGVNVHYIPVHTQPYYQALGFKPGDFPAAEAYYAEALSLPLYATLSEADQDHVVAALEEVLR